MDDLISRQAAIGAIEDHIKAYTSEMDGYNMARRHMRELIEVLPSAQPEQQWILCSEKMPRGQMEVIVSCHDDSGDTPFIYYTTCGFTDADGEDWIVDNEINNHVIAWMPLPEPWRGEA